MPIPEKAREKPKTDVNDLLLAPPLFTQAASPGPAPDAASGPHLIAKRPFFEIESAPLEVLNWRAHPIRLGDKKGQA